MSSAITEMVKKWICSNNIVIFSKTHCPYCKLTKDIFEDLDKDFVAIELDKRNDCDEIQTILGDITGARTVPRVFVNGEFIGGASDIKEMYESGELYKYLS